MVLTAIEHAEAENPRPDARWRIEHASVMNQALLDRAKKDGVIRHHWARRDGTVRDSVMYSILASEWPDVRRHLEFRLTRHSGGGDDLWLK